MTSMLTEKAMEKTIIESEVGFRIVTVKEDISAYDQVLE